MSKSYPWFCKWSKWRSEDFKAWLKATRDNPTSVRFFPVCVHPLFQSISCVSRVTPPRRHLGLAVKVVFCWHTGHLWRKVTNYSALLSWWRTVPLARAGSKPPSVPTPGSVQPGLWKENGEVNTCVFKVWSFCCYRVFLDVCPAGWKSESERSTRKGLFTFQKNSPHYSMDKPWGRRAQWNKPDAEG